MLAGEVVSLRMHVVKLDAAASVNNRVSDIEFVVTDSEGNAFSKENRFIGVQL